VALEDLTIARPLPLHRGLAVEEAIRYAQALAIRREIPLTRERACLIVKAVDGYPLLVEKLVAQARRRDLNDLLEEIAKRRGDFATLLKITFAWSAARLDKTGKAAWASLPLFPAGSAPERLLRAAAGEEALQKLRGAALVDFDPPEQVWRWHPTVAEYAIGNWPLCEEERRYRTIALLPTWTEWLESLPAAQGSLLSRIETSSPNLEVAMEVCRDASYEDAWAFLDRLDACLPLPDRTLTFRELVSKVWKAKLLVLPAEEKAVRAGLLNNLGNSLSSLGRREEALAAAGEATDLYRQLAQVNPEAFLPDLAGSLNNLGGALSDLGRREDALTATGEATDLYRQLAQDNPEAFLPYLASSLNNLGNNLSALGRREDALAAAQEAVAIRRQLTQVNPEAFLPDLAMSLNNLGNNLSDLGRREEALTAAQEATDLYRQLAQDNPEAFLPDLARNLGTYGRVLNALELHAEAAQVLAEGLQHLSPFYRKMPRAFTSLARALAQEYHQACQKAELEPDAALLAQFGKRAQQG
jgi:hypothetical protein